MDINEKLKKLKIEDFIWIIYFFIAAGALYSNYDERIYLYTHNKKAYEAKKIINTTIFVIALLIYIYFVYLNIEEVKKTNYYNPNYPLKEAQLVAALLFLIGGIIYLVAEVKEVLPDEVALI